MKSTFASILLASVAVALPAAAQTAPATRRAAPVTHRLPVSTCAKLPEISPKIPGLDPSLPCAKPLYTLTRTSDTKVDYISPLVGPEVRESLGLGPTTYSLIYVDTRLGTGALALPHKWYTVNYTGYLTDGTKFDSSLDRNEPISFPYGMHGVIAGWDTGFEGMRLGGKRRLFIPYPLAYGVAGHPPVIPAKAELVFDVELISQSDEKPVPKPSPAAPVPATPPTSAAKPPTGSGTGQPASSASPSSTPPTPK